MFEGSNPAKSSVFRAKNSSFSRVLQASESLHLTFYFYQMAALIFNLKGSFYVFPSDFRDTVSGHHVIQLLGPVNANWDNLCIFNLHWGEWTQSKSKASYT